MGDRNRQLLDQRRGLPAVVSLMVEHMRDQHPRRHDPRYAIDRAGERKRLRQPIAVEIPCPVDDFLVDRLAARAKRVEAVVQDLAVSVAAGRTASREALSMV